MSYQNHVLCQASLFFVHVHANCIGHMRGSGSDYPKYILLFFFFTYRVRIFFSLLQKTSYYQKNVLRVVLKDKICAVEGILSILN